MLNSASLEMPFESIILSLKGVMDSFPREAVPEALSNIGIQVVSWIVQDYRKRSAGQEAGGVKWESLTDSAIYSRLRARQPWKETTEALGKLWVEEKAIRRPLRRKLQKIGRGKKKLTEEYERRNERLGQIREERQTIKADRKAMFTAEKTSAQIGVDTGRLVNSFVYGVSDLASLQGLAPRLKGGETPERAIWLLEADSITVGSSQEYAGYFDERRPIIGPTFLNETRLETLANIAVMVGQAFVNKRIGG